jgi:hypothetical protein
VVLAAPEYTFTTTVPTGWSELEIVAIGLMPLTTVSGMDDVQSVTMTTKASDHFHRYGAMFRLLESKHKLVIWNMIAVKPLRVVSLYGSADNSGELGIVSVNKYLTYGNPKGSLFSNPINLKLKKNCIHVDTDLNTVRRSAIPGHPYHPDASKSNPCCLVQLNEGQSNARCPWHGCLSKVTKETRV